MVSKNKAVDEEQQHSVSKNEDEDVDSKMSVAIFSAGDRNVMDEVLCEKTRWQMGNFRVSEK